MLRIAVRAMACTSTYVEVEISPDTTTRPVLTSVSQATRPVGSSAMTASSTPSEIWSATLPGWPSVTDSEVNRYSFSESGWFIGSGDAPRVGFRREGSGSGPHRPPPLPPFFLAPVIIDHERDALQAVA